MKQCKTIADIVIKLGLMIGLAVYAMAIGAQAYHFQLIADGTIKLDHYYYEKSNSYPVHIETIERVEKLEETAVDIEEEMKFDELELLALCVEAEAGNQGLEGKRMVASVILNRVDDEDWPNTITEVISQPYQFTTYWDGAIDRANPTEETYEACRMELKERGWPSIYYFTAGRYSDYGTPWKQVGDHYFSMK